jgi:hypothetical protein
MTESNGYLTVEQIRAAEDILEEDVEVPEWGGKLRVRGMTGKQRDAWETTIVQVRGNNRSLNLANLRARLVARSCVKGPGSHELLFTPADVEMLGNKSAAALERVFDVSRRLSALTESDVEELAKELGEGQSASSGSV